MTHTSHVHLNMYSVGKQHAVLSAVRIDFARSSTRMSGGVRLVEDPVGVAGALFHRQTSAKMVFSRHQNGECRCMLVICCCIC